VKLSIISPINKVKQFSITKYHYALPQPLVENIEYRRFFQKKLDESDEVYVHLRQVHSNAPAPIDVIEKLLDIFWPTHFILPSYQFDEERTCSLCNWLKKDYGISGYIIPEVLNADVMEEKYRKEKVAIPRYLLNVAEKISLPNAIYIEHKNPFVLSKLKGVFFTALPISLGACNRLLSKYTPCPPTITFDYAPDRVREKIIMSNIFDLVKYYEKANK
jgi:hypothetical protein